VQYDGYIYMCTTWLQNLILNSDEEGKKGMDC